jgi:hypothetical protein
LSELLLKIQRLVETKDVRVSEHGYDAMIDDTLTVREIITGMPSGVLLEEYPNYGKGPALLLLQQDKFDHPIHVVWGIPKGSNRPAVICNGLPPRSCAME